MNYKAEETNLFKFCLDEARYRVNEMEYLLKDGFDTVGDYLRANGYSEDDVEKFIDGFAHTLFDNSEKWINSYVIDDMLDDETPTDCPYDKEA